jgi:hypothetical protein
LDSLIDVLVLLVNRGVQQVNDAQGYTRLAPQFFQGRLLKENREILGRGMVDDVAVSQNLGTLVNPK